MLELCPGETPFLFYNCARQDGQRVPTCGGHVLHFLLVLLHLLMSPNLAPLFSFSLVMSFKSLSQLHTQIPPVPSHQSRVLINFGKAQHRVQHPFSCCPTTHLPHQHPCSSSGLHTLKVMPKAVGWPIKMAWSRRGKRY